MDDRQQICSKLSDTNNNDNNLKKVINTVKQWMTYKASAHPRTFAAKILHFIFCIETNSAIPWSVCGENVFMENFPHRSDRRHASWNCARARYAGICVCDIDIATFYWFGWIFFYLRIDFITRKWSFTADIRTNLNRFLVDFSIALAAN